MVSKRKHWVDVVRGICMTAILYDHTDIYYSDTNVIPYELYVPQCTHRLLHSVGISDV